MDQTTYECMYCKSEQYNGNGYMYLGQDAFTEEINWQADNGTFDD